ncbi:hypothetical protein BU16DRAFT_621871 [Lophium mytilinum]|uniref:Uncharacterized protein n=1 Tax=Lophium mytilinum TaxID=390894 RepID=A0A6A6QCQ6_9PEZI|nr:hypothetical protein BU16DRAFT_621871 [Lophium mytilinum]
MELEGEETGIEEISRKVSDIGVLTTQASIERASKGNTQTTMKTMPIQHHAATFPFFDLPTELRLLVYHFVLEANNTGWMRMYYPALPKGSPNQPGSDLRPLGIVQKLLWINQHIRTEVSNEVFRHVECISFSNLGGYRKQHDLDIVRGVLEGIGESGRENIRQVTFLPWWIPSWDDQSQRNSDLSAAIEVVRLLKACTNLETLMIRIPFEKVLTRSNFNKPSEFGKLFGTGIDLIRGIVHTPRVSFTGSYGHPYNDDFVRPVRNWLTLQRIKDKMKHARETKAADTILQETRSE